MRSRRRRRSRRRASVRVRIRWGVRVIAASGFRARAVRAGRGTCDRGCGDSDTLQNGEVTRCPPAKVRSPGGADRHRGSPPPARPSPAERAHRRTAVVRHLRQAEPMTNTDTGAPGCPAVRPPSTPTSPTRTRPLPCAGWSAPSASSRFWRSPTAGAVSRTPRCGAETPPSWSSATRRATAAPNAGARPPGTEPASPSAARRKPLRSKKRNMTGHDAASVAIGRRTLGHPIRRQTTPPSQHQSDAAGHRTAQAGPGARGREGTRPPITERAHDARRRMRGQRTREPSASNTVRDARSPGSWQQMPLLDTVWERYEWSFGTHPPGAV